MRATMIGSNPYHGPRDLIGAAAAYLHDVWNDFRERGNNGQIALDRSAETVAMSRRRASRLLYEQWEQVRIERDEYGTVLRRVLDHLDSQEAWHEARKKTIAERRARIRAELRLP